MLHSFLGMMAEAKKAKYSCKFITDLKKTFSFVRECPSSVKYSVHKFHCTICNVNMSLAHGGKSDIKQHESSKKHKENAKSVVRTKSFFCQPSDNTPPSIKAEVAMTMMLIQHNTFFNTSDHLPPIINRQFSECDAGREYKCRRTKTAAIVNCIGDEFFEHLKSNMQNSPYSLLLDASNDTGIEKMFPITVRIFDVNFSRIMTHFFDMNLLTGRASSTAEVMFDSIDAQLTSNEISWDYCTALGVDNTNVNIGDYNSIKSRARAKNENIVVVGCPCHVLHNALQKSASEFADVVGFDIEDHCVDLCYWFRKSSKRKSILKEYNEFCDQAYSPNYSRRSRSSRTRS